MARRSETFIVEHLIFFKKHSLDDPAPKFKMERSSEWSLEKPLNSFNNGIQFNVFLNSKV